MARTITHPPLPDMESPSRVEVTEEIFLHEGFMRFSVMKLRHERFDGGMTPVIERDVCHRSHAVAIVLYDPAMDVLVMIEQFRVGALMANVHPWMLEFVAGMVKDGEEPAEVAIREAQEEAGCVPYDVRLIHTILPSPGGCTEIIDIFFGLVDSDGLGGIHGVEAEVEDIRVHLLSAERAITLLDENRIPNGFTVLGLSWFARHRDKLRQLAGVV